MSEVAHRGASGGAVNVAPGAVLAGRFRLEQPLGSGGMAEVWRAFDLATQRPIALKLLRPQVAASAEAVQRLKREGEVLSALSHPAIVRVETYGQLENGAVFVAMELLEGETLGARMRRGPMQPLELAPVVTGTCAALAAAHAKGIVHRDLKPDNVFLVPLPGASGSTEPQIKLLDFGISKVFGGDRLTYTGEVLGTPRYMSPEQLGAEPDIDVRVDVYALGVILYEALTSKPPFLASTPTDLIVAILHGKIVPLRSLRPDVPPAVEAVIMRAMARAREARYRSATELADAFLDGAGATARVRALPKRVLQTQALGGAGYVPGSVPPPPELPPTPVELPGLAARAAAAQHRGPTSADPKEGFRPGTFSAFGAVDEAEVRAAAATPGTLLMPTAADAGGAAPTQAPPAAPPPAAPPPRGDASASWRDPARSPALASGAQPWSPPRPVDAAPPPHIAPPPTSPTIGRVVLIVAGLFAGAVSAAIAIAALHYMRASQTPAPPAVTAPPVAPPTTLQAPPESAPPPGTAAAAGGAAATPEVAATVAEGATGEPTAPADLPVAPDVPEVLVEAPRDESAQAAPVARSRRARRGERDPAAPADEVVNGERSAPADPLEEASRALAAGDAARCIDILDDLLTRGATPFAIKRRADCELRAGRRDDAIRDYQRFCRVAPDHPAIASVREQLAGMGLTCP